MKYISTRGREPSSGGLGFEDVLLAGLARDGGLYVPEAWPRLSRTGIADLAGRAYADVAFAVMRPFIGGEVPEAELRALIADAYASFNHPAVVPLVQIGPNDFLLELFHGPTLAFKDVAMQVLARLMDRALGKRGQRATIVAATSGDTGGAAIEAFRGRDAIDIFVLFPEGRVSDVQRRQMTTAVESNVHAIALAGTFDDCQAVVKGLFNDLVLRDSLRLAGVNSINWARIMAQAVYYFTAALTLGAPHRKVSFAVPTGNFGDVFAGVVAARMGLPIERLVIATNANDILARALATGRYEIRGVTATSSPSMDIQVASNFERMMFEVAGRNGARVSDLMGSLAQSGAFTLSQEELRRLAEELTAASVDEPTVARTLAEMAARTGIVVDPHTAVGLAAARKVPRTSSAPMVTLATAHPAKFPDAVAAVIGRAPPEPAAVARQRSAPERVTLLPAETRAVSQFIASETRAARAAA